MQCLSIGCGKDDRPGWVRLDGNPENHPTICAMVPPLPESVTGKRWDVIELNHFLATLYRWEARQLLCQVWQVLAPDGMLIIETPDILFCMKQFMLSQKADLGTDMFFDGVSTPESNTGSWREHQLDLCGLWGNTETHDPGIANRWGYTPRSLRQLLVDCGFEDAKIQERPAQYHVPFRDFRMEATK